MKEFKKYFENSLNEDRVSLFRQNESSVEIMTQDEEDGGQESFQYTDLNDGLTVTDLEGNIEFISVNKTHEIIINMKTSFAKQLAKWILTK